MITISTNETILKIEELPTKFDQPLRGKAEGRGFQGLEFDSSHSPFRRRGKGAFIPSLSAGLPSFRCLKPPSTAEGKSSPEARFQAKGLWSEASSDLYTPRPAGGQEKKYSSWNENA